MNKEMKPCLKFFWPSMAKKNLEKNYVLDSRVNAEEDETAKLKSKLLIWLVKRRRTEGDLLNQSQKT